MCWGSASTLHPNLFATELPRQYLPKGTDLAGHTQAELDAIAAQINNRPRKILGFRTPLQVYHDLLAQAEAAY